MQLQSLCTVHYRKNRKTSSCRIHQALFNAVTITQIRYAIIKLLYFKVLRTPNSMK